MNAYAFNADLYCDECAEKAISQLQAEGVRDTGDSDTFPQGPYADGGGEADNPQHCGQCGEFLENPLTSEGYDYVRECMEDFNTTGHGNEPVLRLWADFYGL